MTSQSDAPTHPTAPDRTGWLPWRDYLSAVETDGNRLVEVAALRLEADVPSCAGWTVADLLEHTARVYLHKVACMRDGEPDDSWSPPRSPDSNLIEHFQEAHGTLLAELVRRDPDERGYTWCEADQTHGFWYRRMAHETAIHRTDAELANADVTPIAEDLALDGIDEMLCIMLVGEEWPESGEDATDHPIDARVHISAGDRTWTVEASTSNVVVTRDDEASGAFAETLISGSPHDVYVWLWGRGSVDRLSVSGDRSRAVELRGRLVEAD